MLTAVWKRMGIENFFDKTLRKNLFIDSQKNLPWTISNLFFDKTMGQGEYILMQR